MTRRNRLLDILIFLLGLAILFDTSVQLAAEEPDPLVWQPMTDEAPAGHTTIEDGHPVFIA